ncbi:MAG: RDD family protein [Nitrospirae bacterium]|nr:RDD family protein [Nitrospirota bacterium]MCL5978339.1 RDD family protein [Nitrospirota bacterium]
MPEDSVKASLLLRVIAKLLDFIVIAAAAETIPRVGYFAGIVYLLIGDGLFNGSSLGKKLVRLRVVSLSTGNASTFRDSIVRNAAFAVALLLYKVPIAGWFFAAVILALEFLLMLGNKDGMRLGDDLANTKVIEGEGG